jgi:hypothetical protein
MRRLPKALSWLETWLQPKRYWLDDVRYVEELTRTLLRYHEGARSIVAGYETLGGDEVGVFPAQIGTWEPPGSGMFPDEAERDRIISAIRQAYASRGVVVADVAELLSADTGIAVIEERNWRRMSKD